MVTLTYPTSQITRSRPLEDAYRTVPELRRRITQRLHVSKHIDGSTTLTHLTESAE